MELPTNLLKDTLYPLGLPKNPERKEGEPLEAFHDRVVKWHKTLNKVHQIPALEGSTDGKLILQRCAEQETLATTIEQSLTDEQAVTRATLSLISPSMFIKRDIFGLSNFLLEADVLYFLNKFLNEVSHPSFSYGLLQAILFTDDASLNSRILAKCSDRDLLIYFAKSPFNIPSFLKKFPKASPEYKRCFRIATLSLNERSTTSLIATAKSPIGRLNRVSKGLLEVMPDHALHKFVSLLIRIVKTQTLEEKELKLFQKIVEKLNKIEKTT